MNVPFIESDLNRVFPGKQDGTYEEKRAFELLGAIQIADLVIDIHSTNTTDLSDQTMIIVTKYDEATQRIVAEINPPKVLFMKYKNDKAVISYAKTGVAFEYGKDTSEKVLSAILFDIAKILIYYGILEINPYKNPRNSINTEVFEVYDAFDKKFAGTYRLESKIRNFSAVNKGDIICYTETNEPVLAEEDFVPILFGENRYTTILGFKARKQK